MQRGRLLSGVLTRDADGSGLTARYRENILGRTVLFTGDARTDGRTCQVTLRCAANGGTFLMAFHLPVLPGNLAGGIFAGSAIYDPDSDPTASVILLLRSEEHTSELQSLMRSSYAVFCLKKKNKSQNRK